VSTPWRQIGLRFAEAAGLVALAYVMGGVIVTIRLHRAGLPSGTEVLALFPAQQLLATGATALLEAVLLPLAFLAFAGVLWVIARVSALISRELAIRSGVRSKQQLIKVGNITDVVGVLLVLVVLVLVVVLISGTGGKSSSESTTGPFGYVALGLSAVLLLLVLVSMARRGELPRDPGFGAFIVLARSFPVAIALVATAVLLAIASALDGPTKLSRTVVYQHDGSCAFGPLVARNSDGVYLGNGVSHSIVSVDSHDVRSLVIERSRLDVQHQRVTEGPCPGGGVG
jgi:hypothetical protein